MGIPTKKSRPITVDGREFRWMVRPEGSVGFDWHTVLTVQEAADHPGAVLQVPLYAKETVGMKPSMLDEDRAPDVPITPEDVADVVRAAIRSGWDPSARGGPAKVAVSLPRWSTDPKDFSHVER